METTQELIDREILNGIREGIKQRLTRDYQNPLDAMILTAITSQRESIYALLTESILSCMSDTTFRDNIAESVRHVMAKTLVQRFSGELEKQVNTLKSDPATRARITLAIEEIVKSKVS